MNKMGSIYGSYFLNSEQVVTLNKVSYFNQKQSAIMSWYWEKIETAWSTQDKAQIEGPHVLNTDAKTTEKIAAANTFRAKWRV
jgi:hypothetical protein